MYKFLLQMFIFILAVFLWSGCTPKTMQNNSIIKQYHEIPQSIATEYLDQNDSYIVFGNAKKYGHSNLLMEYDPVDEKTTPISIFGAGIKNLIKVEPGTHYYYVVGTGVLMRNVGLIPIVIPVSHYDFIQVDVAKGKKYILKVGPKFDYFSAKNYLDIDDFKKYKCNDEMLKKYNFQEYAIDAEDTDKNKTRKFVQRQKYHSQKTKILLQCQNENIINVNHNILFFKKHMKWMNPKDAAIEYMNELIKNDENFHTHIKERFLTWEYNCDVTNEQNNTAWYLKENNCYKVKEDDGFAIYN